VATFRELWLPYYREVNTCVHKNTSWKTFKHSCGAVEKFVPSFLEAGFDILNPVQCSAAGMDAETLKQKYGRDLVFWGGGVDTQQVLPFGTPDEVCEQVLRRCEAFSSGAMNRWRRNSGTPLRVHCEWRPAELRRALVVTHVRKAERAAAHPGLCYMC